MNLSPIAVSEIPVSYFRFPSMLFVSIAVDIRFLSEKDSSHLPSKAEDSRKVRDDKKF